MKIIAFTFDALNSVVFYVIAINGVSSKGKIAASLFGVLGFVLLITSCIFLHFKCSWNTIKSFRSKSKYVCYGIILQTIFGLLMIMSTSSYFLGDNLVYLLTEYKDLNCDPNSTDTAETCGKKATVSSIHLLIFGIIGFRFIPLLEEKATHILKRRLNNGTDSSDIDDKTNFYKTAIESFAMTTELDAWYTAIITVAKDKVFSSACSKYVLYGSCAAFVLGMIALGIYLLLTVIDFRCKQCTSDSSEQKHRHCTAITFIYITLWITSGLYILGDNKHPLDCFEESIPTNIIHLTFVCGSLLFYFKAFLGPFIVNFVALYYQQIASFLADVHWPHTYIKRQTSMESSANSELFRESDEIGEETTSNDDGENEILDTTEKQIVLADVHCQTIIENSGNSEAFQGSEVKKIH